MIDPHTRSTLHTYYITYLFVLVSLLSFSGIIAQTDDAGGASIPPDFNTLVQVPNSPEAYAFTQYGNVPVSMYTGRPDISIPIHTIQGKELSLPISLSYDASGVKVAQIATSVGLGWSLNAGGIVSRQVNGLPDEIGGISSDATQDIIKELFETGAQGYHPKGWIPKFFSQMEKRNRGDADFLPDVFSFNINGLSGDIAIDYSKEIGGNRYQAYCIDNPTVKVAYKMQSNTISTWIITDPNGITYTFGKAEVTQNTFTNAVNEGTNTYNSAWYITSITNANQTETISFEYTYGKYWDTEQPFYGANTKTHTLNDCTVGPTHGSSTISNPTTYKIFQFDLQYIKLNDNIQVAFLQGENRKDLPGRNTLRGMQVWDLHGKTIKNVSLGQSYFTASTPASSSLPVELNYRLKLDEVSFNEVSNNNTLIIPTGTEPQSQKYRFEYHDKDKIPHRFATSIDYWGYNNGFHNSNLIPKKILNRGTPNEIILSGANRDPNIEYARIGTLKKMYYPTGGNTSFWYDLHRTPERFENQTQEITIGGVSLRGGTTTNFEIEDYTSCDDALRENKGPLRADSSPFTIEESGIYKVKLRVNTLGVQNTTTIGIGAMAAIYASNNGTGICQENPLGNQGMVCDYDGPIQPYCYLHHNTSAMVPFLQEGPHISEGIYTVYLPAGDYRTMILSEYTHRSYSLEIIKTVPVTVALDNRIGGLRVYKTEDQAKLDGNTLTKYYYYDDLNKLNVSDITEATFTNQTSSSGIVHRPLIFDDTSTLTSYGGCGEDCEAFTAVTLSRYANNIAGPTPLHVSYSSVTEVAYNKGEINGYTVHNFYNLRDDASGGVYSKQHLNNGKPKEVKVYDRSGNLVKEDRTTYEQLVLSTPEMPKAKGALVNSKKSFAQGYACTAIYQDPNDAGYSRYGYAINLCSTTASQTGHSDPITITQTLHPDCNGSGAAIGTIGGNYTFYTSNRISYQTLWSRMTKSESIEYHSTGNIATSTKYFYDNLNHLQPTRIEQVTSNGDVVTTHTTYPQDREHPSATEQALIAQYRIHTPIEVKRIQKNTAEQVLSTSLQKTQYHQWNAGLVLPKSIALAKNNAPLESRAEYHLYDDKGNALEVGQPNGRHIVYIWGYQDMYPIAKIENATYGQIQSYETDLKVKANEDNDNCRLASCKEQELRDSLQALRDALPNAMVTTYTYDPFVGITSMTDPKGQTQFYEYDGFNRLIHIRDLDEMITDKFYYKHTNKLFRPVKANISSSKNWVYTNDNLVIQSNTTGGSGNFSYLWKVTKPGNAVEQFTSKNLTLTGGTADGTAKIILTITDNLSGNKATVEKSISIYAPLLLSDENISRPAEHEVKTTATFNINPNGGSGNYTYNWRIYKSNITYKSTQKSFALTMGYEYYGQLRIECTVTDTITRETKMVSTTMNVREFSLWRISLATMPPVQSPPKTKKFQVLVNIGGGSGRYSYAWYVDGSKVSSSSNIYLTLRCNGNRSDTVRCEVTDNITGNVVSNLGTTYTIGNTHCNSNSGGGGPNPIDDSDNYNQ